MVDHNDKSVRENALAFIAEVYLKLDQEIWRVLGPLNIKVKGLLDARFNLHKKGNTDLGVSQMNRSINQVNNMNKSLSKSTLNKSINQP